MILVTGATGLIGRELVRRLIEQGESVRILSRRERDHAGEVHIGDIAEPESLAASMKGVDTVYHLAALVDHFALNEALERVNVQGTVNIAEAAIRSNVRRLIHCSSVSAERGGGTTAYGRSKIRAETALQPFKERIQLIVLRPGPVYDAERKTLRRIVSFARRTRLCGTLIPDATVHLASRQNVVDAMILASDRGVAGHAYIICDREPVRRSILSRIITERTGSVSAPFPLPVFWPLLYLLAAGFEALRAGTGIRPWIDRHYLRVLTRDRRYDIQAAVAELGYDPGSTETHFAEAVDRCLCPSPECSVGG